MPVLNQQNIQQSLAALKKDPVLSQSDFANIARIFAFHNDQGRFLVEINAYNKKLAESLLVFRIKLAEEIARGRDLSTMIDQLFLHYVVNTDGPISESEDSDTFDVFDAVTRYAGFLSVGVSKDIDGNAVLHINDKEVLCPEWRMDTGMSAARLLRNVGPVINRARYGRDDVIPSYAFGFDENAAGHTLENAMTLADCAHLAYFNPAYVEKQLKAWGYHSFTWIENMETDTQAFVAAKDGHLVVCFRGTSSGKDMLADLNFLKTAAFGGHGKVHRGFQQALESVWSKVQAAVDNLGADKKLFICGHSLGAALAQLAGHRFIFGSYNVAHIYAFGSPRAANREFMEHYNELLAAKTFLHINNKDIVTMIPLELLGFHHLGGKPRSFNNGHVITNVAAALAGTEAAVNETTFDNLDLETQEAIRQQMYEVEQAIRASPDF
ncbi:MAG: lipase family protein [Ferruginibacter sp.]